MGIPSKNITVDTNRNQKKIEWCVKINVLEQEIISLEAKNRGMYKDKLEHPTETSRLYQLFISLVISADARRGLGSEPKCHHGFSRSGPKCQLTI